MDTIRILEKTFPRLLSMTPLQAKNFCYSNKEMLFNRLDPYEQLLFHNAIEAIV